MTFRRLLLAMLAALAIGAGTPAIPGVVTPAAAQPAELGDFHLALEAYGMWQTIPRFGEVWVPFGKPRDWRPYTIGHWVYTDEWGWYWISEEDEEDWGWITFHYGRWARNAQLGWFWIPGDEWGPAWVNWRDSDDVIGWSPLPPDDEHRRSTMMTRCTGHSCRCAICSSRRLTGTTTREAGCRSTCSARCW